MTTSSSVEPPAASPEGEQPSWKPINPSDLLVALLQLQLARDESSLLVADLRKHRDARFRRQSEETTVANYRCSNQNDFLKELVHSNILANGIDDPRVPRINPGTSPALVGKLNFNEFRPQADLFYKIKIQQDILDEEKLVPILEKEEKRIRERSQRYGSSYSELTEADRAEITLTAAKARLRELNSTWEAMKSLASSEENPVDHTSEITRLTKELQYRRDRQKPLANLIAFIEVMKDLKNVGTFSAPYHGDDLQMERLDEEIRYELPINIFKYQQHHLFAEELGTTIHESAQDRYAYFIRVLRERNTSIKREMQNLKDDPLSKGIPNDRVIRERVNEKVRQELGNELIPKMAGWKRTADERLEKLEQHLRKAHIVPLMKAVRPFVSYATYLETRWQCVRISRSEYTPRCKKAFQTRRQEAERAYTDWESRFEDRRHEQRRLELIESKLVSYSALEQQYARLFNNGVEVPLPLEKIPLEKLPAILPGFAELAKRSLTRLMEDRGLTCNLKEEQQVTLAIR